MRDADKAVAHRGLTFQLPAWASSVVHVQLNTYLVLDKYYHSNYDDQTSWERIETKMSRLSCPSINCIRKHPYVTTHRHFYS